MFMNTFIFLIIASHRIRNLVCEDMACDALDFLFLHSIEPIDLLLTLYCNEIGYRSKGVLQYI